MTVRPLRSAVIVLALTLAGALTLALFAIVDGMRHPRPPFASAGRVVDVSFRLVDGKMPGVRYLPEFAARRAEMAHVLNEPTLVESATQMGLASFFGLSDARAAGVQAMGVDATFFSLLSVPPVAGTSLLPGDEQWTKRDDGNEPPLPVVIGASLAERLFGSAGAALGLHELAGRTVLIRGVMPTGVKYPGETNVWAPVSHARAWIPGLIRLREGVDLESLAARLPELNLARVTEQQDPALASLPTLLLSGAALLVVVALLQCAALLSAEVLERANDARIRLALGATRWDVARPYVIRVAVLVAVASALAVLALPGVERWLIGALPLDVVRGQYFTIHTPTIIFGAALACIAGVILCAAPLSTLRVVLSHATGFSLRESAVPPRLRWRFALLTAQIALTTGLAYVAALACLGLLNIWSFDYGFQPASVLIFRAPTPKFTLGPDVMKEANALQARLRQSLVDLERIPGVIAADGGFRPPIGLLPRDEFEDITVPARPGRVISGWTNTVGPGYFRALGARVIAGRDPASPDLTGEDGVVINRTMAEMLAGPGGLGLELHLLIGETLKSKWMHGRIVAVVDDLVQRSPERIVVPEMYDVTRSRNVVSTVVIRVAPRAEPAVRAFLDREYGPLRAENLYWMTDDLAPIMEPYVSQARLMTLVMSGAIPIVLIGVFGAMNLFVRSREYEIGVRLALGAQPGHIRWVVAKPGVLASAIGWCAGVGMGAFFCRVVSMRLFEQSSVDAWGLAMSACVLVIVTSMAAALPIRRAAHVDPLIALRRD